MLKSTLRHLRDAQGKELEGEGAGEAGFTLIELMVVLLIIAILLAIAIPTFLGVTNGANDRAAQSNLTNALTESAAVYQSNSQSYTPATGTLAALMQSSAPEFTWTAGANVSASQAVMSVSNFDVVATGDGQGVALAVLSKTGTCWYAVNLQQQPGSGGATGDASLTSAGTFYAKEANGATNCKASYALGKAVTGTTYSNANVI